MALYNNTCALPSATSFPIQDTHQDTQRINSLALSAAAMAKAQDGAKALRQLLNERTAMYFAAAMCSLIGLFIICHWSRILYCRYRSRGHCGSVERCTSHLLRDVHELFFALDILTVYYRHVHNILCHRLAIGRLSVGQLLLYLVYWAINLILCVTGVDFTKLYNVRCCSSSLATFQSDRQ